MVDSISSDASGRTWIVFQCESLPPLIYLFSVTMTTKVSQSKRVHMFVSQAAHKRGERGRGKTKSNPA